MTVRVPTLPRWLPAGAALLLFALLPLPAAKGQAVRHRRRARRAPVVVPAMRYATPRSVTDLDADLSSMLTRRVRSGRWGVIVVSLTRGDTLYEINADQPLRPASTMKLFTSALAFDRLGPDYE